MRFARCVYTKSDRLELTPRKIAATKRRLARKRNLVELLPELAAEVPTVEQELARHQAAVPVHAIEQRTKRAQDWRRARRLLAALPESTRRGIMRYWQAWSGPLEPVMLLTFIDQATRFGVSYWTEMRKLRQLYLIGQRRFPQESIKLIFPPGRFTAPRQTRDAKFYCRRRAAKIARRQGKAATPQGRQMLLGE